MKGDEGYLVREGVCVFLKEESKEIESARAAVSSERWYGRIIVELFSGEWLALLSSCVMERVCGWVTCV